MTIISTSRTSAPSTGVHAGFSFDEDWRSLVARYDATPEEAPGIDALDHRFGLLASLRPGWDGPHSCAISRAALSNVYAAVVHLESERIRDAIEIGASGDGYLRLELETENTALYADVHDDHIEYEAEDSDWTGPLSADDLRNFLLRG